MSRLLFLLAVAIVVYLLLKSYRRQEPRQDRPQDSQASEEMVRCEQCGVHLPRSESFLAGGKFFCSDEHRRQYNAK